MKISMYVDTSHSSWINLQIKARLKHLNGNISPKMEIFKFILLYIYFSDVFGASETSLPRI
jgi:hypothetical protein